MTATKVTYGSYIAGGLGTWSAPMLASHQPDNFTIVGETVDDGFPTTPGAYDEDYNGDVNDYYPDVFITRFLLPPSRKTSIMLEKQRN